jgi:hypothetical protein
MARRCHRLDVMWIRRLLRIERVSVMGRPLVDHAPELKQNSYHYFFCAAACIAFQSNFSASAIASSSVRPP